MLFRSLAYFRDCEDAVRGDEHKGTSKFLPDGGLCALRLIRRYPKRGFHHAQHSVPTRTQCFRFFLRLDFLHDAVPAVASAPVVSFDDASALLATV